jgi:ATP-dependent helicase/nuclease subunit B
VLLAFAERIGTAPALPSRLLQRLEAFLGDEAKAMRARGERFRRMARALDAVAGEPRPAARPAPRPPAARRPRRLSVTEIETLVRSPYDIHARHVLGLYPLPPLGEVPDTRERGMLVHAVFARFVHEGHHPSGAAAAETLERLAAEAFAGLDAIGERRDIWLHRFRRAAELFLAFERDRDAGLVSRDAEVDGRWTLPNGFVLTGRADRIDRRRDGGLDILDFKTGSLPAAAEMRAFLAPQLLLEAAMAGAGAFEEVPPAPVASLTHVKIGLGPDAFAPKDFALPEGLGIAAAAEEAAGRLARHVEAFLMRDDRALVAGLLPRPNQSYAGAYDHLARRDEWAMAAGDAP